jgi:hypothetical protein
MTAWVHLEFNYCLIFDLAALEGHFDLINCETRFKAHDLAVHLRVQDSCLEVRLLSLIIRFKHMLGKTVVHLAEQLRIGGIRGVGERWSEVF